MTQVFARYAKDMLEKQTYPEVRRSPTSPPEPPYDVTRLVARHAARRRARRGQDTAAATARLEKLTAAPTLEGRVTGNGPRFVFDYRGPDAARAINALLKQGARATFEAGERQEPRALRSRT